MQTATVFFAGDLILDVSTGEEGGSAIVMSIPKTTVLLLGNVSGSVTVITTTYLCGLDFLDSEHTSVAVVGNHPTMLTITKYDKELIVDKKSIQGIMTVYVCKCKVELLLWEVNSAYVRSDDIDRLEFVTYIAHNIMGFKLEGRVRRCRINFIPDDLYHKYLEKVTMLQDSFCNWGFHLISSFLSELP